MFGDDAIVKKPDKKEGLVLDNSQIEVLENSYRSKEPNFLSAFSEETFDMFLVDSESEKYVREGLETLLKSCKEKKKQTYDLVPDMKKKDLKRKFSGNQSESNKRPAVDNQSTRNTVLNNSWNNFRIPKVPRDSKSQYRNQYNSRSRGAYNSYSRRTAASSRGTAATKSVKTDDK
ncbi:hypothetical protein ACF0H5_001255 [Mactra antiquata]